MQIYKDLLRHIIDHGVDSGDRTGTGTRSIFGHSMRFDLSKGFPAMTTKKLAWKSVVSELLWFLEGSTDERRLAEIHYGKSRNELIGKTTIWTANADAQGKALGYPNTDMEKRLGPVYGAQWRYWNYSSWQPVDYSYPSTGEFKLKEFYFDQIREVIKGLKEDPHGRRHLVSAWNPPDLIHMALPPCHYSFQFYVRNNKLSCLWNQRSVDVFLGLPFNVASYALLTHIIARECGFEVGDLIAMLGDTHIYSNHFDQVEEQLTRSPLPLPTLEIDPAFDLNTLLDVGASANTVNFFTLKDYQSHETIRAKMAV